MNVYELRIFIFMQYSARNVENVKFKCLKFNQNTESVKECFKIFSFVVVGGGG